MKNRFFKPVSYLLILSLGLMFTFSSCNSDPEAMELPPAESLIIDLSQFPTNSKKSSEASIGNWLYSSLTVLGWNVAIAVNVAIPIAAYAEAFNNTPVYLGDESWEWSYTVKVDTKNYDVSLIGTRLDNATFSMEMSLSEEGGYQNFKWFEGVIRYDHTMADWTISHSPQNSVEYLDIHFEKDYESNVGSIRYTVIDPQNELYNGYVEYGIDPVLDFDAYYTIFVNDSTTYIEWNTTTGAGRVMDSGHFSDELWHCWDGQLQDVDCNVN